MSELIAKARAAIDAVFGNRRVPKSVTRDALLELLDDIDEFSRIAGAHSIAELVQNVPGAETLIKKACAIVAEQARQNIRNRESGT